MRQSSAHRIDHCFRHITRSPDRSDNAVFYRFKYAAFLFHRPLLSFSFESTKDAKTLQTGKLDEAQAEKQVCVRAKSQSLMLRSVCGRRSRVHLIISSK